MGVVSLETFKRNQDYKKAMPDERVWDRAQRLSDIFTGTHFDSQAMQTRALDDAVQAVVQYIENERPIEKSNRVRDDQLAEIAGAIQAKALMASARNPDLMRASSRLSEAFMDTFMLEEPATFSRYRQTVDNIVNAAMTPQR